EDGAAVQERAVVVVDGGGAEQDRQLGAVLASQRELEVVHGALRLEVTQGAREARLRLGREQLLEAQLAFDLLARVAEPAQPGSVDLEDQASGVQRVKRAGCVLEELEREQRGLRLHGEVSRRRSRQG